MLDIDITRLEQSVAETVSLLKDGLIATDIWDRETGLSLAGHNPQAEAVALFNLLTNEIQNTLATSGFPTLSNYYLLELEANHLVVIMRHGDDLMSGMLLDSSKTNLGVLVSVAIPRRLAAVNAARGGA